MAFPYIFSDTVIMRNPGNPLKLQITDMPLEEMLADKSFVEALFLASPILYEEAQKVIDGQKVDKKEKSRIYNSVAKYFLRMSNRCTPFGMFSGCSVVEAGENSSEAIRIDSELKLRSTRLDMHFLCALAEKLSKIPPIKNSLTYTPNTSLYNIGDELRFVEYYYKNSRRVHEISAVSNSEYLLQILEKASKGAKYHTLLHLLIEDDISEDEAGCFLDEIISSKILVNSLEPAVAGKEFLDQILDELGSCADDEIKTISRVIEKLKIIKELLMLIDSNGVNSISLYNDIMQELNGFGVKYEVNKLFQTDRFFKLTQPKINNSALKEISEALEFLNKINIHTENSTLSSFKKRFYERYADEEMPLLNVLDAETGIGYQENKETDMVPLVQDIFLPGKINSNETISLTKKDSFILNKIKEVTNKENEINFTDKDVKSEAEWKGILPSTPVLYRMLQSNKILLESAGGSSAANLLSRFAHGSKEIENAVKTITTQEAEKNPGVILAEIVHLPESRVGNILMHPTFREFEIPFLSASGVSEDFQLYLQDLFISVRNDRIILRSKRLNKEIIPRLSSAHNFVSNALPVYQFLGDMQLQGKAGSLGFYWGALEYLYDRLPRVSYKNVVLAPAQWRFNKETIDWVIKNGEKDILKMSAEFRLKYNLPQYIVLADNDNELLVNLEDCSMIHIFIETIKRRPQIIVKEFFFPDDVSGVMDEKGNLYNNQFIAVLMAKELCYEEKTFQNSPGDSLGIKKEFAIGSEWIYFKLYCGYKTADLILTESIKPSIQKMQEDQILSSFFFIRYADPSFHLRIRFKVKNVKEVGQALAIFMGNLQPFIDNGMVWKTVTDSYKRELTRYHPTLINCAEALFHNDSLAVLEMLDLTEGDERSNIRWQWTMVAINSLLNDFHLVPEQKLMLMEMLKNSFLKEFNADKHLKAQLTAKYRAYRNTVENLMNLNQSIPDGWDQLLSILNIKSEQNSEIISEIISISERGQNISIPDLLSSYIHMLVNRVITSNARLHELVIYDMLYSYYRSQVEKEKQKNKNLTIKKEKTAQLC